MIRTLTDYKNQMSTVYKMFRIVSGTLRVLYTCLLDANKVLLDEVRDSLGFKMERV